jgi:hypothetical protein
LSFALSALFIVPVLSLVLSAALRARERTAGPLALWLRWIFLVLFFVTGASMNAASDRDEGFRRGLIRETTSRASCGNSFAPLYNGFFHTVRPMCPMKLEVQTCTYKEG